MVVCTHTSVVMPPMMRRLTPCVTSRWSRSVAQKHPLPGLSMMSSPGSGASSGISSQPGSPRTRILPQGPSSPMPAPIWRLRQRLLAGRSARLRRWPSRVWITFTPAARAAASTRRSGSMGARVRLTSYPICATYPPSPQKSCCMSISTSATSCDANGPSYGHAYGRALVTCAAEVGAAAAVAAASGDDIVLLVALLVALCCVAHCLALSCLYYNLLEGHQRWFTVP
mmetsp:Transcript_14419/g.34750  ORF Transcript_14419/g.34750 Transcript_14419/m.34750 type:complete len:227 (+) Transcript_14419:179-859(+)